jgi:hypothetical protein
MILGLDRKILGRVLLVALFSIAFAYIESSVVVYLRAIFYKDGFIFPITDFSQMTGFMPYLLTEIGREAATLVLIVTGAILIGKDTRSRWAWFLIIFAVWDIFYYVWLKVLLNWPASILDWDILFLMPAVWAGPVLAPVITSCVMLWAAWILLRERAFSLSSSQIAGLIVTLLLIVVCFCVAGVRVTEADYAEYFSWRIFLALHVAAIVLIVRGMGKKI